MSIWCLGKDFKNRANILQYVPFWPLSVCVSGGLFKAQSCSPHAEQLLGELKLVRALFSQGLRCLRVSYAMGGSIAYQYLLYHDIQVLILKNAGFKFQRSTLC